MHDWNWISFLSGSGCGVLLTIIVADIVRSWKRGREAKKLAQQNDAAIRCRHGIKRWKVCTDCAADFAHINPCKTCHYPVDDRWPAGTHYCPGISGHSGFSGYGPVRVGPRGLIGFIGISGYSGFSGFPGPKGPSGS